MNGTSSVVGASMLAHGVHVVMVLLGLWGLAALLLPQAIERHRTARARRGSTYAAIDLDEHAQRVTALRAAVAAGTLPTPYRHPAAAPEPGPGTRPSPTPSVRQPVRQPALGLPLALVAGATAAGIHAAVAPAHLAEERLFGVFFLVAAAVQLAWVVALVSRPTPALLRRGIVLQAALIALWAVTRLVGLPFGLLPDPHPLGAWDITCALWEVACVASCVRVLRGEAPARTSGWSEWHPTTRAAVGAASVLMVLLTVVGAHS